MKRYLGMTEQELSENETAWAEEQGDNELSQPAAATPRNVGITPGAIASDMESLGPDTGVATPGAGPDTAGTAAGPGAPAGPAL